MLLLVYLHNYRQMLDQNSYEISQRVLVVMKEVYQIFCIKLESPSQENHYKDPFPPKTF